MRRRSKAPSLPVQVAYPIHTHDYNYCVGTEVTVTGEPIYTLKCRICRTPSNFDGKYTRSATGKYYRYPKISDIYSALDDIARSMGNYDEDAYHSAYNYARKLGCTEAQLEDVYTYTFGRLSNLTTVDITRVPKRLSG